MYGSLVIPFDIPKWIESVLRNIEQLEGDFVRAFGSS
jgi:hypothetical protein